jgi:Rrf2 family nitric oxide-sensitive transcriptional repressor
MRLTVYTDYTMRVLMYLAVKHPSGALATIDDMSTAYGISRAHLMKIVNELASAGFVTTLRGRGGGVCLARAPAEISVGDVVRFSEKDFAVVACQDTSVDTDCAIYPACGLRHAMQRAVQAFLAELDAVSLADAVAHPRQAVKLLGMDVVRVQRRRPL